MSDFVRKPLLQQLNKDNPITRIENLESGSNAKTSAIINSVSELSGNMGEMVSGQFNFYNPNTGQLVGYLSSVPLPGYPSYYFVMTDAAGNVQFSVDPSTSGGTTMGNGNVAIAENGVTIANGISSYIFKDVSGNANTIYLNGTTDNALELRNNATSGDINIRTSSTDGSITMFTTGIGGDVKQTITLTDASTPYIKWWENPSELNTAYLEINAGATSTNVKIGTGVNIRANLDGTETVFNETSYDIDFRIEGATNTSLFYLNAGLDAIGIGKAATSDYLLDVNGDVNIPATYNYKIAGVNLPQGDGWSDAGVTWSYASASTFTITGDYTAVYTKGTKINWTQTTVKYGVVLSSSYSAPNTTVTIAVNTDYTIANAAISLNHYSRAATPAGFPSSFAFSPTWTNVTVGNGTQSAEYSVIGNTVKYKVSLIWAAAAATSAISGAVQITVPISVLSDYVAYDPLGAATIVDNGVSVYQGSCFYGGSNIVEMRCLNAAGTYVVSQATSGTVPFTFGVNDRFMMEFSYIF